ncbi:terminase small subunit [Staphylococcus hominis]|uniref:terminase small subunit n=1 Tax=Staphylococcus hominis TaxID=1290 RepID=UPI0011A3B6D1|nr:terminase small subunit [Staphylococcus hominis]MDU3977843.1 terminase small subunit [Staphylococcus sp.]MBC2910277.1 terminase small subunit [Staphylococcus hominis]MBC2912440.1 terminase small subunit [Staphylococcus hominis]MBC2914592.1 terminase small subunit [Staphylococcus hominis]MBC2937070.1 terminase small subunit [Staphylococcus hominis]
MKSLTLKQKQFADEYIRTGNAYQSAINVGYSEKYAKARSHKMLENVGINQYIDENLEIIQKESIAEADEIMRYLTRVLRGEEKEEILVYVGDGMQEIQTIKPSAKDRIKAAELLGKRYRLWTDKQEVEITTPIFIDDVPEED